MNIWYLSAHDQPKGLSSRTYDFSRELVKRGHKVTMFTNGYCHFTHTERLAPGERNGASRRSTGYASSGSGRSITRETASGGG
jgi:hypothetical protein